jgi:hypothetical protein
MFTINEPSSLKGPALMSGYAPRMSRASRIKRPPAADPENGSAKVGHGSGVIISLRAA